MDRRDHTLRDFRLDTRRASYVLVVRGPDGRPSVEAFDTAAAYRARLITLEQSPASNVSIEEIVGLLNE